jgi:hypothetical protein
MRGGALIDQKGEQFQRGRIDPVQVFHDKEHGLLDRNAEQEREEGVQSLLLLLLGRPCPGRIVETQRQREKGGEQRHGLRERQTILHQEPLKFAQLLLGGFLALKAQCDPFEQINHGIQGGVLMVGGTLAQREPRLGLGGHLLGQYLHETRFANARFAAEQHHLSGTVLHLRPALLE